MTSSNIQTISNMTERLIKRFDDKGVLLDIEDKNYILDYAKWIYSMGCQDGANGMTELVKGKFDKLLHDAQREAFTFQHSSNEITIGNRTEGV